MRDLKQLLLICVAVLPLAACGGASGDGTSGDGADPRPTATVTRAEPDAAAPPSEQTQARSDFDNFCVRCHRQDGTGGPFELDDGATLKVPSLRERGRKDSDAELAAQIRKGGDGMPAFGNRLDEQRINDLVNFIRAEFHGRPAAGAPAR